MPFLKKWDSFFTNILETETNEYDIHDDNEPDSEENIQCVYQMGFSFFFIYLILRIVFSTSTVFVPIN